MSGDTQVLGPASSSLLERITLRLTLPASLLAVPILIFLAIFFFYPAINLLFFSLLTQDAKGIVGPPLTLAHYARFFEIDLYLRVFWNTLRISLVTSAFAIVLGYPVAIVMARSGPIVSRIIALIVIAPLIVSVVVRSYGWQLILANTPAGLLNWVLMSLGITSTPLAHPLFGDRRRHRLAARLLPDDGAAARLGARQDRSQPRGLLRGRWALRGGRCSRASPCRSACRGWWWASPWCSR